MIRTPLVLVGLAALLALSGALLAGCPSTGSGTQRLESNLGKPEQDPEKFKKGVEELMAKEKAAKGK